ncbi:hypothetical protein [Sinomonas halotolerans]|uniref:Uncharacterized protein n=1 Tax=Sinomonas halotolerans TaxID=1644133 RepID=A0ABU9X314_9MICC
MSQDTENVPADEEAPRRRTPDVASLPDGSGNDRDADEGDDERFDAG